MTTSLQVSLHAGAHLSDDSLARQRALLLVELKAKAAQGAELEARVSELTGQTDVDSILERELADAGAARAREAIGEIQKALDRLDVGSYGWCEACGAPIPLERLEVIPEAQHCVACPRPTPAPSGARVQLDLAGERDPALAVPISDRPQLGQQQGPDC